MKYHLFCLFLAFFTSLHSGNAQIEKTIHQTFELGEANTVQLDIYGDYTLSPWAGNNILVETNIQLYNSSEAILKHFIEKDQRYKVDVDTVSETTLQLFSHDKKRPAMRTKSGVSSAENVVVRIFVPDNFTILDNKTLVLEKKE